MTFLFTDIEGSTALLHALGPQAYSELLADHRRSLRQAFAHHGGVEVDTQGDAFFYAFRTAEAAIHAARHGQEVLASHPIRVRMGLHTGTPHLVEEGYVGEDVHKGARIAAAGHGGQVLLSRETCRAVDADVTDLGEHRLRDFAEPVWIFQLGSERFPPLRTVSNTNLPHPASSFVGRQRELQAVISLVDHGARFVTLTGPGGSGKTRLALEAATTLAPRFKNGVLWVGLAALRDATLVTEAIAHTLGAKGSLADHIGQREILLLLDNLEQVVAAGPELASLVEACPSLRLLVTSRELLRVRGELEYPVEPLTDPEAVELFCARSRLAPEPTVAELCRRLDDLPLAVELAAAQTSVMSPGQILERISQRLDLLKGGRDAVARQRTLRATIEWSYELLSRDEETLLRRLSVFADGWTLEAAEAVAGAELDVLQSLVDQSLVRHADDRFRMLETIREYASERLSASGEEETLRTRHARWFVSFVEGAEPELVGPRQREVGRMLEREFGNVRAAFAWCLGSGDIGTAARLVVINRLWQSLQGHLREGRGWLDELIARPGSVDPSRFARALVLAGDFRRVTGDLEAARGFVERALSIQRDLGEQPAIGLTLWNLGRVEFAAGHDEQARVATEESVAIARAAGDRQALAEPLAQLGEIEYHQGGPEPARPLLEEALALAREAGDAHAIADSLRVLGMIERDGGRLPEAEMRLGEALTIQRELSDQACASLSLSVLGEMALRERADEEATALFTESLTLQRDVGQWFRTVDPLWGLAAAAATAGRLVRAARLLGAEAAIRREGGFPFRLGRPERREDLIAAVRERMDGSAWASAWREGEAMGRSEALEYAIGGRTEGASSHVMDVGAHDGEGHQAALQRMSDLGE